MQRRFNVTQYIVNRPGYRHIHYKVKYCLLISLFHRKYVGIIFTFIKRIKTVHDNVKVNN